MSLSLCSAHSIFFYLIPKHTQSWSRLTAASYSGKTCSPVITSCDFGATVILPVKWVYFPGLWWGSNELTYMKLQNVVPESQESSLRGTVVKKMPSSVPDIPLSSNVLVFFFPLPLKEHPGLSQKVTHKQCIRPQSIDWKEALNGPMQIKHLRLQ